MWDMYNINTIQGSYLLVALGLIGIMVLPIVIYVLGSEVMDYVTNLHNRGN